MSPFCLLPRVWPSVARKSRLSRDTFKKQIYNKICVKPPWSWTNTLFVGGTLYREFCFDVNLVLCARDVVTYFLRYQLSITIHFTQYRGALPLLAPYLSTKGVTRHTARNQPMRGL